MSLGGYISTAGHAGLIGFVLIGPGFESEPLHMEDVQQVSVISEAAFQALLAGDIPPDAMETPAALAPPDPEVEIAPDLTPEASPTPDLSRPDVLEPETPDAVPEPPAPPEPPEQAEVTDEVIIPPSPEIPTAPEVIQEEITSDTPTPRAAPRMAPEAVAPPAPDVAVDDVVRESAEQSAEAEAVVEDEEATAPEEASSEIVTEAEEAAPSGAVASSLRPRIRPNRPTTVAERPRTPTPTEAPATETASDPLAAALAEALTSPRAPAAPSGPPLTAGERDALRVAVQRCWNVGALSTEALNTIVVVGVDMAPNGTPVTGSIRMLSSSGGSADAAERAYQAARRAIIRCGTDGFDLPREKYDQWKEIEMTFNPSEMRIR